LRAGEKELLVLFPFDISQPVYRLLRKREGLCRLCIRLAELEKLADAFDLFHAAEVERWQIDESITNEGSEPLLDPSLVPMVADLDPVRRHENFKTLVPQIALHDAGTAALLVDTNNRWRTLRARRRPDSEPGFDWPAPFFVFSQFPEG
jgi:hypothetical protein